MINKTLLEVARWGASRLADKGIEDARADADRLLAKVTSLRRDQLYLEKDKILTLLEWEHYQESIKRREGREPLQYILNLQEFMGLEFYVDHRVLIPRPETELLVEKLLEFRPFAKKEPSILDLCTGSGAIAISVKYYFPEAEVCAVDISEAALEVARYNAQKLGASIDFRLGDFFSPLKGESWDFMLTNPPYVSEEAYSIAQPEIHKEPPIAFLGGFDGLSFYRRLASQARGYLNPQGMILMEIGWDQGAAVCNLFNEAGFHTECFKDLAGRDRLVLAR